MKPEEIHKSVGSIIIFFKFKTNLLKYIYKNRVYISKLQYSIEYILLNQNISLIFIKKSVIITNHWNDNKLFKINIYINGVK